jgi:hypothetical protein
MSSLIECLVDPNCHGMHDDNYHNNYEKEVARKVAEEQTDRITRRQERPLDTWHVRSSSGEYTVDAESLGHAYLVFTGSHYDDFVQAITLVDQDELDRVQRAAEVEASAERARARTRVQVHHAAIRGHCDECNATYRQWDEHDALCRSRISGETEDRCNCG